MVNTEDTTKSGLSTKAKLLIMLREAEGKPVSGSKLAAELGVSRVAVWKGIQTLSSAGYPVDTQDTGYSLDPAQVNDFLYPWEFGEKEAMFRHFANTGSTMDRVREFAVQGHGAGLTVIAERQSAGRGRNGRTWNSRNGGLFCTILDRPKITMADYCLPVMLYQIAAARALGSVCGKPASLRWPNDIYINRRKIAGLLAELAGEGDSVSWLGMGIGINVNNQVPLERAASCASILGHQVSRRDVLLGIFDEAERLRKEVISGNAYSQGNRLLADRWNSIADCMGAKAAVIDSASADTAKNRVLAKGIFAGVDPSGRCIIKSEEGKGAWYFNPGPVSVVFLSGRQ